MWERTYMHRIGKTRYTTGAFAKLFGINKDTLLYYDKINLFKPALVGSNGYRYYEASQIEEFWTLSSLRDMGVSIKKLSDYVAAPSPERLCHLITVQEAIVKEEIKRLQNLQSSLLHLQASTEEGREANFDIISFVNLKETPMLYSDSLGEEELTSNTHWGEAYTRFVKEADCTGILYTGSVIAFEDIQRGEFKRIDRLYMMSSDAANGVRSGGLYGIVYVKGAYEELIASYPTILNKIQAQGYSVCGNIFEEYVISHVATNKEADFVTKLYIPVKGV